MRYCPYCGSPVADNLIYCNNCKNPYPTFKINDEQIETPTKKRHVIRKPRIFELREVSFSPLSNSPMMKSSNRSCVISST